MQLFAFLEGVKETCRNKINTNIKHILMSEWEIREKETKSESLDETLSYKQSIFLAMWKIQTEFRTNQTGSKLKMMVQITYFKFMQFPHTHIWNLTQYCLLYTYFYFCVQRGSIFQCLASCQIKNRDYGEMRL